MWTKKEKLFLYNQYEILKLLDPDNSEMYLENQRTIEYGSEADMDHLIEYYYGTSTEVADEVWNILQMQSALTLSYHKLKDKGDLTEDQVLWKGFDGTDESEHYAYAKYLIHDKELYDEFKECEPNSHWHTINSYREKLKKYEDIILKRGKPIHSPIILVDDLSYEEINEIIR